MSHDLRHPTGAAAPVYHIASTTPPWQTLAVLGMLGLQFCFLMLLTFRLLLPADAKPASPQELAAVEESLSRLAAAREREDDINAKLQVLDLVVRQGDKAPAGVLQSLAERTSETLELRSSLRAQQSLSRELEGKISGLETELAESRRTAERSQAEVALLESKVTGLAQALEKVRLESPAELASTDATAQDSDRSWWAELHKHSKPIGLGALLGIIVAGAALAVVQHSRRSPESDSPDAAGDRE